MNECMYVCMLCMYTTKNKNNSSRGRRQSGSHSWVQNSWVKLLLLVNIIYVAMKLSHLVVFVSLLCFED